MNAIPIALILTFCVKLGILIEMPTKPAYSSRTPLLAPSRPSEKQYTTPSHYYIEKGYQYRSESGADAVARCFVTVFATVAAVFSIMGIMTLCGVGPWVPGMGVQRRIAIIGMFQSYSVWNFE